MKTWKIATATALAAALAGTVAMPAFADRGEGHGWRGEGGHHRGGMMRAAAMFMDKFDQDKDGKVTQTEIDAVVAERFTDADLNGDGTVTLDEFKIAFAEEFSERRVREFQRLDRDGDGKVTKAEFDRAGERMFSRLDRNDDDAIGSDDRKGRRGGEGRRAMRDGHHGFGHGMGGGAMMREFFDADTDADGTLTKEEFTAAKSDLFAKADKDGDGAVTLVEFQEIWLSLGDRRIVRAFQRLDTNGDLKITREEADKPLSAIVSRMDRNGDGALSIADRPKRGEGRHGDRDGRRWRGDGDGPGKSADREGDDESNE